MFKISNNIYDAIKNNDISIEELSYSICSNIRKDIYIKYVDESKNYRLLWEKLSECEFLKDSDGWSYIKDFVNDDELIMFFNEDDENKMFRIKNGEELYFILSETYGYEFYITNINTTYLICFNHHDILCGCGEAKQWVKSLKK